MAQIVRINLPLKQTNSLQKKENRYLKFFHRKNRLFRKFVSSHLFNISNECLFLLVARQPPICFNYFEKNVSNFSGKFKRLKKSAEIS